MREYIATHAKVLGTTPINACTAFYFEFCRPAINETNDMTRCLVAALVHYKAPTITCREACQCGKACEEETSDDDSNQSDDDDLEENVGHQKVHSNDYDALMQRGDGMGRGGRGVAAAGRVSDDNKTGGGPSVMY